MILRVWQCQELTAHYSANSEVHRPMSAIRRFSFIGEFLPKILFLHFYLLHILYDILDRIQC